MAVRILLAYHSSEGQTAAIAQRIAERLRTAGAEVELSTTDDAPAPSGFDGVLLGDSIHLGRHSRSLLRYAAHHAAALAAVPSALFQVSLTSATHDEIHDAQAQRYVEEAIEKTGWDPDAVGAFAGALLYTRYGWIKRHLMHAIASRDGGPTDTSQDQVLTDWAAVDHFADDVLRLVEHHAQGPA